MFSSLASCRLRSQSVPSSSLIPWRPLTDTPISERVDIRNELRDTSKFLWVDRLPEAERAKAYTDMRAGRIVIDKGKRVGIPDGLIHHWTGAGFVPGATLQQMLGFIQDYNHHSTHYRPDVRRRS